MVMSMIHGPMNQAVSIEPECPAGQDIYRHLSVTNIGYLLGAYGAAFAESVMRAVQHRLRHMDIPELASMWVDLHQAGLYLRVALHPGTSIDENLFDEMLAVTVCSQPVVVDRRAVLVDISVDRIANAGEGEHASAVQPGYAQPPTRFLQQVFMQNMTAALALHRAIGQKSFELWTRPILATDNTATLYQECLIGLRKRKDGESVEAGRVAPALPQNISTRHIDRFIVRKTIELLRRHPSVQLGCHICALSAVNDTWWSSTFKLLAMAPTLAIRLVIEITDTAAGADIAATQQFCERLQSMGCRIAVNGFSDGDGSVAFALAIKPDIVKVSMPVIHAAQAAPPSRLARQLGHFLSGSKACVVAEGVQAERDRETLRRAGIPWAMGCCIGPFGANGNAHFPLAAGFHALLGRLAPIE
jgi:EAL domain-containing protein (putative c-di-GMP-specific phosphodiesterase class I)